MRVEDLDPGRVVPGAQEKQLAALRELGIDWDEGPDVGGPFAPYVQSQRSSLYAEAISRLRAQGEIFPCYCSRAEIARASVAPHGPADDGPRYPGTCRALTEEQRREREAQGRKPAWRFRVRSGVIGFDDGIAGHVEQDVENVVGDFVVQRADGVFAYQLAVVVDDIAMNISHVLRGDDLLGSTPRQLLLYEALGAKPPSFFHVPLVLGPSGERLSKRDGPVSVSALAERGVSAAEMVQELAELCGMVLPGARTAKDLLKDFALDRLPRSAPRWSPQRLLGG